MALTIPEKYIPIRGVTLSLEDIDKILQRLDAIVSREGDREISHLIKPSDLTDGEWEERKKEIKDKAFRITITINGDDNRSLYVESARDFSNPNRPEKISSVFATNVTAYQGVSGSDPINKFSLTLDFAKPPLVDGNNIVSAPTPNNSNLSIRGDRDEWVASVESTVMETIRNRKNTRPFFHIAFSYDIGLMILALPIAFYMTWKVENANFNWLTNLNDVLRAAFYIYFFLLILWIYRILFGYTKWAFPVLELDDDRNSTRSHRRFWYLIVTGLIVSAISELIF